MADSNDPGLRASSGSRNLGERVRSLRLANRDGGRAPRSRFLPWLVSCVLLLTTVAFAYRAYRVGDYVPPGDSAAREAKPSDKSSSTTPPPTESVVASGEVVLQSKGYVTPISLVQVSPKVGGQLITINPRFREGEKFLRDEILAEIEDKDYKTDHDQAKATWEAAKARLDEMEKTLPEELRQAEADLEESRQNATQLRLDYERNRRLSVGAALTQRELEQAKYGYEAMQARIKKLESNIRLIKNGKWEARLEAMRADVNQNRASYDRARLRYEWTKIRAPIDGTVLTKKAEQGNIVNPSAFSSGISASLCDMANLRELEIDLSIQERDIAVIKKDQFCSVMPEAYQADKEFLAKYPKGYEGYVSRLMPTADRAKGAIPVRVKIKFIPEDEAGVFLRPDMGALVSFIKTPERQVKPMESASKPAGTVEFPTGRKK